jgi:hypothetical protein
MTGAASAPAVTPGVVPAWAVTFSGDPPLARSADPLTVGSAAYDGSVTATLPSGLAGGSYQIVIEGMTDTDYGKLLSLARGRLRATLYLWWLDSSPDVLGDLARFTGLANPLGPATVAPPTGSLVADLRVDKVSRRAGERRYEVTVTGRERVMARLGEARAAGACYEDLNAAVQAVAGTAGITITTYDVKTIQPGPDQPDFATTTPGRALNAMNALAGQVRNARQLSPLPVMMIRDGALHLGTWTGQGTVAGLGVTRQLDEGSGLVAIDRGGEAGTAADDPEPGAAPTRDTVVVTAVGRPDIKPGDTVRLLLPPTDFPVLEPPTDGAALLTALTGVPVGDTGPAGHPSACLVSEVSHRISRRQGFVTTVRATVLGDDDSGWDKAPGKAAHPDDGPSPPHGTVSADPAAGAASAVQALIRTSITGAAGPDRPRIAQIHDHPASGVPRHTSVVRYSTAAPDGLPVAAQRTQITGQAYGEMKEVPYLTPFGWGHFGLVLPRYPGTRVLLASAGGGPGDLIDLGAVWERDSGPASQPGDYWLVLPIGMTDREHLPDGGGAAADGPANHDLIDGDGNRIIETARFVVRVTDQPTHSDARPDPTSDSPAGSVLIETKPSGGSGARIQLKDDGSVTITATSISLDAGQGDIKLKANNVKVSVTGTMDVS